MRVLESNTHANNAGVDPLLERQRQLPQQGQATVNVKHAKVAKFELVGKSGAILYIWSPSKQERAKFVAAEMA